MIDKYDTMYRFFFRMETIGLVHTIDKQVNIYTLLYIVHCLKFIYILFREAEISIHNTMCAQPALH